MLELEWDLKSRLHPKRVAGALQDLIGLRLRLQRSRKREPLRLYRDTWNKESRSKGSRQEEIRSR